MAPGLNRVAWNLQYPGATTFPGMILWGATTNGPIAVPGSYQVRLTVDGRAQTQPLVVKTHPLYTDITEADLREQFDLAIRIRDKVSEANNAVIQIRSVKAQVAARLEKSSDARLKEAGGRLSTNLGAVEEEIYQVRNQSGQDPLNFPIKINNRLASLARAVNYGELNRAWREPSVRKKGTGVFFRRGSAEEDSEEKDSRPLFPGQRRRISATRRCATARATCDRCTSTPRTWRATSSAGTIPGTRNREAPEGGLATRWERRAKRLSAAHPEPRAPRRSLRARSDPRSRT